MVRRRACGGLCNRRGGAERAGPLGLLAQEVEVELIRWVVDTRTADHVVDWPLRLKISIRE